jgi:hypothetical protein
MIHCVTHGMGFVVRKSDGRAVQADGRWSLILNQVVAQ